MTGSKITQLGRLALIVGMIGLLSAPAINAKRYHAKSEPNYRHDDNSCSTYHDDINWEIKHGSVILTNRKDDTRVEITDDYQLFVNDELVRTNKEQTALLKEYHETTMDVIDEAKEIGVEGAKIGVSGAALGLKAVSCVVKLLSPNYDSDDLERDMEFESDKIEQRASKLEERAEKLEDKADRLDDIADKLDEKIPELAALGWF